MHWRFCPVVTEECILSAGWGVIRTEFITPKYDITYSQVR